VLHDAAYLDMVYFGGKALSFLEIPGAREVGIELHSLSKTFNMTGWRIGFAAGNKELVAGLLNIKTNVDSGVFNAVQHAGIAAMRAYDRLVADTIVIYEGRVKTVDEGIRSLGWRDFTSPKSTFYVWIRCLDGRSSVQMVMDLLRECSIVTTPGTAFGEAGEGFFRLALTTNESRIQEAFARIRKAGL
jgi:LL-diaminopimelate aminotransferase